VQKVQAHFAVRKTKKKPCRTGQKANAFAKTQLCAYANTTVDNINSWKYIFNMEKPFYQLADSLGHMTMTAHRLLSATLRRKFKESEIDLKAEQWGVLIFLWERESATQDELAMAFSVDKSSMSRLLSSMDDAGLIVRTIDPENERKKNVRATQHSYTLRERGFEIATKALANSLNGVSQEDAKTCIKVLAAVKQNLSNRCGEG